MTGAPENHVAKTGTGAPCSQCAHSRRPAHRYSASSWKAVLDQNIRRLSAAWTIRMASSGHGSALTRARARCRQSSRLASCAGQLEGSRSATRMGRVTSWTGLSATALGKRAVAGAGPACCSPAALRLSCSFDGIAAFSWAFRTPPRRIKQSTKAQPVRPPELPRTEHGRAGSASYVSHPKLHRWSFFPPSERFYFSPSPDAGASPTQKVTEHGLRNFYAFLCLFSG